MCAVICSSFLLLSAAGWFRVSGIYISIYMSNPGSVYQSGSLTSAHVISLVYHALVKLDTSADAVKKITYVYCCLLLLLLAEIWLKQRLVIVNKWFNVIMIYCSGCALFLPFVLPGYCILMSVHLNQFCFIYILDLHYHPCFCIWLDVFKYIFIVQQFIDLHLKMYSFSKTVIETLLFYCITIRLRFQKSYCDFVYSNYEWSIFYMTNNQSQLLGKFNAIDFTSTVMKMLFGSLFQL